MKHKNTAMVLGILSMILLALQSVNAQSVAYTKNGYVACYHMSDFVDASTFWKQKDFKAVDELVRQNKCFYLKPGILVYFKKQWYGADVHLPGSTNVFCTFVEALDIGGTPPPNLGQKRETPPASQMSVMYKWVDEKGTVHFADDIAAIPEQYRENVENVKTKSTKPDSPQEKRVNSKPGNAIGEAPKGGQEQTRRERANYYCREATRLKRNIERADAKYQAYSTGKDPSRRTLQSYYNDIVSAQKELDDFEEQARKNEIPPGWLRCQIE
jgi:hypothetical protein